MIDRKIPRVRLRDLARLGRFRSGCAAATSGHSAGACASRGEPAAVLPV